MPILYENVFAVVVSGSSTSMTVHVQDAQGNPIANAYLQIAATFPGGGTIPWAWYTDSNGNVQINIPSNEYPVQLWSVSATNYTTQSGTGNPPATVTLPSTVTTPAPTPTPTPTPPAPAAKGPNYGRDVLIGVAILSAVAIGAYAGIKLAQARLPIG